MWRKNQDCDRTIATPLDVLGPEKLKMGYCCAEGMIILIQERRMCA
jgi:hypothetical protein